MEEGMRVMMEFVVGMAWTDCIASVLAAADSVSRWAMKWKICLVSTMLQNYYFLWKTEYCRYRH